MTALERLLEELANPLEASWYEPLYDLELTATLVPTERATLLDRLRHEALRGNHRAIRTLVRLGERALVVDALTERLDAEFYSLRMRAWEGLVEAWELMPRLLGPDGKKGLLTWIEHLGILIACDLPGLKRLGIAEMRALVDRLAAGETPESLGIAWEPDPAPEVFEDLRGALFDLNVPYPLDAIGKLTGGARRMAEIMIAMRLEEDDPRVVAALTSLGAQWALDCLPGLTIPTLTMIVVPAEDREAFDALSLSERRQQRGGWATYEVRSGLRLEAFFLSANRAELAVTNADDKTDRDGAAVATALLDDEGVQRALPRLVELVETNREETAQALCARRGQGASLSRVAWALRTGTWATNGDAAEEAAAFAHHLLRAARLAAGDGCGVCWEYRGRVVVAPERDEG